MMRHSRVGDSQELPGCLNSSACRCVRPRFLVYSRRSRRQPGVHLTLIITYLGSVGTKESRSTPNLSDEFDDSHVRPPLDRRD
ncbi:hypothetical protein L209DRAFT_381751 [Thermothelomyces heterothallicus CBS 203.75]